MENSTFVPGTSLGTATQNEDPLAQWKALYSLLASALPGLQGSLNYAFQFSNPEMGANWWQESSKVQETLLADAKPSGPGAFYAPGATLISQNYGLFLNAIIDGEKPDRSLVRARENYDIAEDENRLNMSIEGDLNSDLEQWRLGQGNKLNISLSRDTKIDYEWHVAGEGAAEYSGFVISGSGEVLDTQIMDTKYHLSLQYNGMKAYSITRDRDWWNGGLLHVYNSDYTEFIHPYTRASFFDSKSGLLNLVPAMIVVGYDVRISLQISEQFYDVHHIDLEGSGSVNLGPYKLNGTIRYLNTRSESSENALVIEYESMRRQPVVFGVFSEMFLIS